MAGGFGALNLEVQLMIVSSFLFVHLFSSDFFFLPRDQMSLPCGGNDESESDDDDPDDDGTSKGGFFNTNSEAAKLMSAHTFYLCTVVGLVCLVHLVIYIVFFFKNTEVPGIIGAPAVEIELFLALFMVPAVPF
mmetsp:Transcript_41756/g.71013  ORF Transcript_41756/g.71013 Transcript_41756/m.71013 type:complete len:134 (-) Transcript_41756:1097-1498(-)